MAMTTTEHDFGKDHVVMLSGHDVELPPRYELPPTNPEDQPAGAIMPNGDINWDCPCLGGMASGPCAYEFQQAFSCFHYSKEEPKGKDCMEQFQGMQVCIAKYPHLYPTPDDNDGESTADKLAAVEQEAVESSRAILEHEDGPEDKFLAAAAASQQKQQESKH